MRLTGSATDLAHETSNLIWAPFELDLLLYPMHQRWHSLMSLEGDSSTTLRQTLWLQPTRKKAEI